MGSIQDTTNSHYRLVSCFFLSTPFVRSEKISELEKNDIKMRESMDENLSGELAAAYHIEPEEEKRVIRKLDRTILPLMALIFFFQCR